MTLERLPVRSRLFPFWNQKAFSEACLVWLPSGFWVHGLRVCVKHPGSLWLLYDNDCLLLKGFVWQCVGSEKSSFKELLASAVRPGFSAPYSSAADLTGALSWWALYKILVPEFAFSREGSLAFCVMPSCLMHSNTYRLFYHIINTFCCNTEKAMFLWCFKDVCWSFSSVLATVRICG